MDWPRWRDARLRGGDFDALALWCFSKLERAIIFIPES